MKKGIKRRLFAEWEQQSGVQLSWPHAQSDWADRLPQVEVCFVEIATAIAKREKLLVSCPNTRYVATLLKDCPQENLLLYSLPTNDTWARDYAPISVEVAGVVQLLDFQFNGWGLKFPANLDNALSLALHGAGAFGKTEIETIDFVLEGGSLETDGAGTLLTTSQCLLSYHRNPGKQKADIEAFFNKYLGIEKVLWLDSGYLMGDDTDAHIDTLARFAPQDTIIYTTCQDSEDSHFHPLKAMEKELMQCRTMSGQPYRLLPLPLPDPIYAEDGHRLPATYANFLVINEAVLLPVYGQPEKDSEAARALQQAFPQHEIVCIDCRVLIEQHGSLHCVTMQYPEGVL